MQPLWTDDASQAIGEIARRHGFGEDAGRAMAEALAASAGAMAQFHHPELGGMGQWSRGGMLMIGDMFNHALKGRVAALAADLADAIGRGAIKARRPAAGEPSSGVGRWWPDKLGAPSSSGAQNGRRYAVFPAERRLAIEDGGRVRLYDTADHRIGGAAQQQGGSATLSFSTDRGPIGVEHLAEIDAESRPVDGHRSEPLPPETTTSDPAGWTPAPSFLPEPAPPRELSASPAPDPSGGASAGAAGGSSDPVELIRKLAALKDAGALTDDEFRAKKTELLARI